jgi:hypothetical protein
MYYTATPVHIIEAQQNLLRDMFAEEHGDTLVLMSFDQTKEVLPKHLKNHTNMDAIGSFVSEVVKERNHM